MPLSCNSLCHPSNFASWGRPVYKSTGILQIETQVSCNNLSIFMPLHCGQECSSGRIFDGGKVSEREMIINLLREEMCRWIANVTRSTNNWVFRFSQKKKKETACSAIDSSHSLRDSHNRKCITYMSFHPNRINVSYHRSRLPRMIACSPTFK